MGTRTVQGEKVGPPKLEPQARVLMFSVCLGKTPPASIRPGLLEASPAASEPVMQSRQGPSSVVDTFFNSEGLSCALPSQPEVQRWFSPCCTSEDRGDFKVLLPRPHPGQL